MRRPQARFAFGVPFDGNLRRRPHVHHHLKRPGDDAYSPAWPAGDQNNTGGSEPKKFPRKAGLLYDPATARLVVAERAVIRE